MVGEWGSCSVRSLLLGRRENDDVSFAAYITSGLFSVTNVAFVFVCFGAD